MFLSVALNFRRPIYPPFYSFAKIFFQTLSRNSPAFGPTKLPVGTKGRSHCPHPQAMSATWRLKIPNRYAGRVEAAVWGVCSQSS